MRELVSKVEGGSMSAGFAHGFKGQSAELQSGSALGPSRF